MPDHHEIIVVSGLPRSGTSLMMQMLAMGGIQPLTDGVRVADADNPKGYFEYERVKKIKEDTSWLPDARGKAVKMISQLLYDLPNGESYRVIFMRRDLDEVIASQEQMLIRRGVPVPDPGRIKAAFSIHLERLFDWLTNQPAIELLEVDFNGLLTAPVEPTQRIADFVARNLDVEQMLRSIDSALYRNRESGNSA